MRARAVVVGMTVVLGLPSQQPERVAITESIGIDDLADHQLLDIDGDGRTEIVVVTRRGLVRVFNAEGRAVVERPEWRVEVDPIYSLLAFGDVLPEPGTELVVADRRGLSAFRLAADDKGPVPLLPRPRQLVALGSPAFAPLCRDINGDGVDEILLPDRDRCHVLSRDGEGAGFRRVFTLPVETVQEQLARTDHMGRILRSRVAVPAITLRDLDGDARLDAVVEDNEEWRAYLQQDDGTFPEQPRTIRLDMFRDTSPPAPVAPGRVLAGGETQHLRSADLDGDGVPDYVIAHRRKLWVFMTGKEGPQFERARTRRLAEDASGMVLVDMNADGRTDLLAARVLVPDTASLALGLVSSIRIEVTFLGYAADADGEFAEQPTWRREISIEVPALLSLMSQMETLRDRFEKLLDKRRPGAVGRLDGAANDDVAMLTVDRDAIDLWYGTAADTSDPIAGWLHRTVFEDANTTFDVDRLFSLAERLVEGRNAILTDGRPASTRIACADPDFVVEDLELADLDGDGRDELLLIRKAKDAAHRFRIDVVWPE